MLIAKRLSKGSALTHAEMDNNFSELEEKGLVNEARITVHEMLQAVNEAQITALDGSQAAHETRITAQEVLQAATDTAVVSLQAELDSNQATAQLILQGSVARLTAAKASMQTSLTAWQATSFSGATSTGDPDFDNLLNSIISELVTSVTAAIADIDANISELSVNFEI